MPLETWTVGAEYDETAKTHLREVIESLGYKAMERWWGVGGSQEMTHVELVGPGGQIEVEAETYVGLTVKGNAHAIAVIREAMEPRMGPRPNTLLPPDTWIRTDFNGFLEHGLLCLAHSETASDVSGRVITLREGMTVTAFDDDFDDSGNPDRILVTGTVERSPEYAQCRGSVWSLRVDAHGVQWESQLPGLSPDPSLERTREG